MEDRQLVAKVEVMGPHIPETVDCVKAIDVGELSTDRKSKRLVQPDKNQIIRGAGPPDDRIAWAPSSGLGEVRPTVELDVESEEPVCARHEGSVARCMKLPVQILLAPKAEGTSPSLGLGRSHGREEGSALSRRPPEPARAASFNREANTPNAKGRGLLHVLVSEPVPAFPEGTNRA